MLSALLKKKTSNAKSRGYIFLLILKTCLDDIDFVKQGFKSLSNIDNILLHKRFTIKSYKFNLLNGTPKLLL